MIFWTLGLISVLLLLVLSFLAGMLLNPYARVKMRRQFLKQDYGIAKLLSKDGRAFQTRIINLGEASFELGDNIWFSKKGYVYRENHEDEGFFLKKISRHTEEGLPCVYLDSTSLKPISLHVPETKQTPNEMSAWLRTNSQIQVAKGLVGDKKKEQIMIATLAVCILLGLGMFVLYGVAGSSAENAEICVQNTAQIKEMLTTVHGISYQNGTLVFGG